MRHPIIKLHLWCGLVVVFTFFCGRHFPTASAQLPAYDPSNSENWFLNPVASDEFDGTQLDTSKWHIQGANDFYYSNFIGRAPSQFSTDNVRLESGNLKIETKWDPGFDFSSQAGEDGFNYENITTAAIVSRRQVDHGYMEVRAKAADASVSSSFWMLGNQAELDVYEFVGRPSKPNLTHIESDLWSSIHDWSPGSGGVSTWTDHLQLPFKAADGFHTYGIEWDENYLKFHADGQLVRTVTRAQIGEAAWTVLDPMRMWIDSEVFHWRGLPAQTDLPKDYEVDYVRVWHHAPTAPVPNGVIFDDDFSASTLDLVWNTGNGFSLDTGNESVTLSTNGNNWGAQGDNAGLLNSDVGYASFTVAADGSLPIGGNFEIGNTRFDHSANAIARINLANKGEGTYELAWNNSGTTENFEMASGWSGNIAGNSFVWIVDGDTANPVWGNTIAAANVDAGDAANAFGFWHTTANSSAIIDDFVLWDVLTTPSLTLAGDFNSDGVVDAADFSVWRDNLGSSFNLNGAGDETGGSAGIVDAADYALWQTNFGASIGSAASAVPEPEAHLLIIVAAAFLTTSLRRNG